MKKIIFLVALLITVLVFSYACCESTPIRDFVYVARNGEAAIRSYTGSDKTVIIPDEIDGCKVTTITKEAFKENKTIEKVVLPESLTTLSDSAFEDCSSLAEINIPENVTIIPRSCFKGCESLSSIQLPEGIQEICNYAFYSCKSLNSINFPANRNPVLKIGYAAFDYCALSGVLELNADWVTLSASFQECKFSHVIINTDKLTMNVWDQGMYFDSGCFTCNDLVLYISPEATVTGSTVLIGSKVSDLTIFAPDDGTLFEKQDFSGVKNIMVYARPGTKALERAEEQWFPTNSDQYKEKVSDLMKLTKGNTTKE